MREIVFSWALVFVFLATPISLWGWSWGIVSIAVACLGFFRLIKNFPIASLDNH
ncbi:MAG: hypothetical protein UY31_C0052G0002 [Candidatus Wolfebacteria bacterium GW2011_GWE1_48_7]|nr:MAG: hypothetical protein UY31_C0052G0002 [Candidatus Wolfebacteria bacterium GW2011_GWE1_48_7]